jgi:hypothetical protein
LLQLKYEQLIVQILSAGANAFKVPEVVNWEGDQIDFRVHTAKNTGMGFVEDGGAYSVPDKQDYAVVRVGRRFWQAKLQVTIGAMAAARTGARSFRSVLDSELRGMTSDAMDYFNRMFFLDGTGVVATIKNTGSTSGGKAIDVQVDNAGLLWKGGEYDVYDTTLATKRGTATVETVEHNIDSSSGYALINFTSTLPSGTTATDVFVWKGSLNRAITGLDALIDNASGTFQNVNTATYPEYVSYVNTAGSDRPITPLIFRQTFAATKQKMGNRKLSQGWKCYSNAWLGVEFEQMYEGSYRLESGKKGMGYEGASFISSLGRVDLECDTDTPRGKIYLLDPTQIKHAVQKHLGFEKDGETIFRKDHNSMHASAIMTYIGQMFIKNRNTSAKIEAIDDSAVVAY